MKIYSIICLLVIALCSLAACCDDDNLPKPTTDPMTEPTIDSTQETATDTIPDSLYAKPQVYPKNCDSLRILTFGNSFTADAMQYIRAIVNNSGIDRNRLCIYSTHIGGAGLDTWLNEIESTDSFTIWQWAGNIIMNSRGTARELLHQNWNVILVTQSSDKSYTWTNFSNLGRYIQLIRKYCPNDSVCIGYQLPWSHTPDEMPHVLLGNIECYQKMKKYYHVDTLIPTGTAIQLARGTGLNDSLYLTRDKWHLNTGIARYIASCTWFQALVYPDFGQSIVGNKARPDGDYTDVDILKAQICAQRAVITPYDYTW